MYQEYNPVQSAKTLTEFLHYVILLRFKIKGKKLQIIEYFKNGMKNKDLSEKYKVHHSAISKIIHNKDKILQHKDTMEKCGANKNVLSYSLVHDSLFEKCTFLWFCQKRALGEPVTGPVLQAKAKQFHAGLNVDSNFSASNGWLARFKKRQRRKTFSKRRRRQCVSRGLHLAGPVQTQTVAGLLEVIRRIPGCGKMSLKEVENWIDKDQYEPPYKVFNDSQLIEIAKGGIEESDSEEELLNSNNNKSSDEVTELSSSIAR
ncbi:hypothetical protein NQ318_009080 [Aromia moschata]|uniref:HTH CENPB-type domain-containing protein n=1 Tax=Aromia moschata TaxID=1265417 RepID=A0AAV8YUI3_9CUCU|nr:hypothetical protein NQ318_009080 [Aromia moschata]